jgi:hypothetical protein
MNSGHVFLFTGLVPIVAIVAGLSFGAFVHWVDSRRKEREAFYKAETLRRITEASGDGAKAAIELLREDERVKALNFRERLKIGGLFNIGLGVGLAIFVWAQFGREAALCGLIPGLIGVAMLVYVYLLAPPVK